MLNALLGGGEGGWGYFFTRNGINTKCVPFSCVTTYSKRLLFDNCKIGPSAGSFRQLTLRLLRLYQASAPLVIFRHLLYSGAAV
jgi:hypothetical protein